MFSTNSPNVCYYLNVATCNYKMPSSNDKQVHWRSKVMQRWNQSDCSFFMWISWWLTLLRYNPCTNCITTCIYCKSVLALFFYLCVEPRGRFSIFKTHTHTHTDTHTNVVFGVAQRVLCRTYTMNCSSCTLISEYVSQCIVLGLWVITKVFFVRVITKHSIVVKLLNCTSFEVYNY